MLIVTSIVIPPSRSVKEDLFYRSGFANEFSYTPFIGLLGMVREQFNTDDISLEDVIANIPDLKLDKLRPHAGDDPNDEERSMSDDYDIRFEDIGQEWIDKYGEIMLIGYKLNQKNSYREYLKDNLEYVRVFQDDETGEYVSESDLISNKNIVTSEYLKAKNKIPYLLKILFNGSIYYGIHLLSCLIAYNRAKQVSSNGEVTSRAFRRMGIYRVDDKGKITRMLRDDEDSSSRYQTIWRWICGDFPNDMYYKASTEFLSCLLCCNVDITLENPLSYDLEFFQKLNVSYIPDNDEFVMMYSDVLGGKVRDAIDRFGLENVALNCIDNYDDDASVYTQESKIAPQKCIDLIAANTSNLDKVYAEEWSMTDEALEDIDDFLSCYIPYIGDYLKKKFDTHRLRDYIFNNGYMVNRKTGLYFYIIINPLLSWYSSDIVLGCISKSGNLVVLDKIRNKIRYISCRDVCEFVKTGDEQYKKWHEVYIR